MTSGTSSRGRALGRVLTTLLVLALAGSLAALVPAPAGAGGLSGPPLAARSLEVLRRLRAHVGDGVVLISVGGVETAEQAWERIAAGATLVQAYTGFVYGGPLWPARINRELARMTGSAGHPSIAAAIGSEQRVT